MAAAQYTWSPAEARAHEVLVAHQRLDIGSCGCGWGVNTGQAGRSHCEHVLEQLSEAGLLLVELPQRIVDLGTRGGI